MTDISKEAVERLWERWNPGLSVTELRKDPDTQQSFREDIEAVLDVERPAIQAQVLAGVKERLLSQEAILAAAKSGHPWWDASHPTVKSKTVRDMAAAIRIAFKHVEEEMNLGNG